MRLLPYGDRAVLVELDDGAQARALAATLRTDEASVVGEIVTAARTVLVVASEAVPLDELRTVLRDAAARASQAAAADEPADGPGDVDVLVVPVVYDGDDLDDVASLTGLTRSEVVEAHTGQLWRYAFGGFAPGFGYLVGENDSLHTPRRTESRTTVPAGSVALADEYSGVYPTESPGGWQLLGRTELAMFDLDRDPPALLRPGVRVRFEQVGP